MQSNTLARLVDVWAASPTDVWAVGNGRIMRWDGTSWYRQTEIDSAVRTYVSVCGRSSQDMFFVAQTTSAAYQVLRYQGAGSSGTWSVVTPGNGSQTWTSVHCRGNDVWVGGSTVNGSLVGAYAYAASGAVFGANTAGDLMAPITSIWTSTEGDVYAADTYGVVHKRDGSNWPPETVDGSLATSGASTVVGNYISGTTGTNVFVAGLSKPASHHGAAAGWIELTNSDDLIPAFDISAVPNGSTALLVGQVGAVLECSATSCAVSPTNTDNALLGVWAIDQTHAFIVGTSGTILY
jgi:hypothetical protein